MNSEIEKMGQSALSNITKNLFQFGGGKDSAGSALHSFFSGIMSDMMNSWWKQMSSQLTSGLFGLGGPEAKLQSALQTAEAGLAEQMQTYSDTTTGPLTTAMNANTQAAQLNMQSSQANLQAAQINESVFGGGVPIGSGTGYVNADGSAVSSIFDVLDPNAAINAAGLPAVFGSDGSALMSLLTDIGISSGGGASANTSSGGPLGFLGSLLGFGGGGAGAAGALGKLGGLGSLASLLPLVLGAGSGVGGLLGASTGTAGSAQHQQYGMFGALAGLGAAGGIGALLLGGFGSGGFMGMLGTLAAGGPIGLGILAASVLGGSLLGGLFGDHFPISDEPDIGEPVVGGVSYGQFVANMNGAPGSFNGTTINPFSQYSGTSKESAQLFTDIQKVLGDPTASAQLKQMAQTLEALNPNNASNGYGIASEFNDVFTLGSGQQINVQQFQGEVQSFMQAFGQSNTGSQQLAPIMAVNVLGAGKGYKLNPYNLPGMTNADFEQFVATHFASWSGTYNGYGTPGVGTGGTTAPPPGSTGGFGGGPYGGGGGVTNQAINIDLLLDGKVVAQIVNAYNAQALLNAGQSVTGIPQVV